jgi:hypothetical protein
MALNYGVSGPTPQAVVRYAMSHLGKDEKPLCLPRDPQRVFTPPVNLYEIALYYGHPQMGWVTDEEEAQARLRELLSRDLPVIVDVTVAMRRNESNAAHFVVVTGIGADNSVYVNDPYGRGTGGKRLSVTWEDFYWAWQHNSDGPVGGRGWWMVSVPTITAVTTRENPSCRPQLRGCVLTLQP